MDYKKLGLKSGIEIHQQLDTNKLFCNCPSELRDDEPDTRIKRKLSAVAGETGKIDIAAAHEQKKKRFYAYEAYDNSTCEVELDQAPPRLINEEALRIALQIALMLNAKPVDYVQVMRKTVVDGSNTSGFQRTALIAREGYVETESGRVSIPSVCLEEDAARRITTTKDSVTFRLDRLGIPLVEITTGPEIISPEQAKEVAAYIGMVLRSTGKVKRGLGTIRQDVNVSIKKGTRVEIKGVQDLKSIPDVIENEIQRQLEIINSDKKVDKEVRKANKDNSTSYLRPMPGPARMYPETDLPPIKTTIKGIELPKLLTEQFKEIEEKHKLSKELSQQIVKQGIDLDKYVKKYKNIPVNVIASTLVETPKELKKRFGVEVEDFEKQVQPIFEKLNNDEIPRSAVLEILVEIAEGKKVDYLKYKTASTDEIEAEIKKLVEEKPELNIGALMGVIMGKFKGKIDGKQAMEILRKYK